MKKYLLILLLIGQFGNAQYNLFARQNFAKSASTPTYNTYIGGVSATISSASSLATKLGISVGAISNFTIVGSDIKCKITGSYGIPSNSFITTPITYWTDEGKLITSVGINQFVVLNSFLGYDLNFENCTTINDASFSGARPNAYLLKGLTSMTGNPGISNTISKIYYIPNCLNIGGTSGNDGVLSSISSGTVFYCHPSLATNNSGSPDGDLSNAISQGAVIRYVTDFTAPSAVTTLAAGTIYNTAIQLNFTPPSSTNTIDYYEVYKDGIYLKKIYASGEFITGLSASTSYDFTLIAVDIFYNKSSLSNILNTSTNTTSAVPTTGLISYYKLDANSNDSFGSNNGTDTSVSYVSGKVSNAGSYNGTSSKSNIGNPANLQISTGSISCWIKTTSPGASDRWLFGKTLAYGIYINGGVLTIYSWAGATGSKSTGVNIADGNWHHVVYVFESGTSLNYVYLDGVLKLTTSMTVSGQGDPVSFGGNNYGQYINALIDEGSVYNVKLTQAQVELLYNSGIGTTL